MRLMRLVLVGAAIVATVGAGGVVVATLRDRIELSRAIEAFENRRYNDACERLKALSARHPGRGEIEFPLGGCELALRHNDRADEAWARVPKGSPRAAEASLYRARIKLERHRFADAERLLLNAVDRPGPIGDEAILTLIYIWKIQDRYVEAKRLLKRYWIRLPNRAEGLRELWRLTFDPYPSVSFDPILERAAKAAPDDDRVRLGLAYAAIRARRFAEARAWIEACRRGDEDQSVIRCSLAYMIASDDTAAFTNAVDQFKQPVYDWDWNEFQSTRAWFGRRVGDLDLERDALERLAETDAGAIRVLDRLAEIAITQRRTADAATIRLRKVELDACLSEYRTFLFESDPLKSSSRLASLADRLGLRFEAAAWREFARSDRTKSADSAAARTSFPAVREPRGVDRDRAIDSFLEQAPVLADRSGSKPTVADAFMMNKRVKSIRFVDDADRVGLRFRYERGESGLRQVPETMGGGVGLIDYDGDGKLDVYFTQGCSFPPRPDRLGTGDRLFHAKSDGTYEDVTAAAGLENAKGYGLGVAVADYDDDGDPDLFVTRYRGYALYQNQGNRTFKDVTNQVGLGGDRDWPVSAAFADLDGDGDLDLYVCHYIKWDEANPKICRRPDDSKRILSCPPKDFAALADHLFRNDGGVFVDVSAEAGIVDRTGRGMGVVAADLDGDGKIDVFVADDQSANLFWRNTGGMRFLECAGESGLASNASGGYMAGMGVACGDLDGDGLIDLAVTNFYNEASTLYHNLGGGRFADHSEVSGLTAASRRLLGFGAAFVDVNNDGNLDYISANGYIEDLRPRLPYGMRVQLLLNDGRGRLIDPRPSGGDALGVERVGRGLAVGDLDDDGRIDAIVVDQTGPVAYLHNQTDRVGRCVVVKLEGTESNRDGVGAFVTVRAGGKSRVAVRYGGGSYQSASDPRLHFGVGDAERIDEIEVAWPSGRVDRIGDLAPDRCYLVRENRNRAEVIHKY